MPDTSIQQVVGGGLGSVRTYEQAISEVPAFRDASMDDQDSITALLNAVAAFNGIISAGEREIRRAHSIDDINEFNKATIEASRNAGNMALWGQQRLGELLSELPKNTSFRGNQHSEATSSAMEVTKADAIANAGISKSQAYDLQKMAENPDIVQMVIDKAEADGTVARKAQVLRAIDEKKRAERERDMANRELDAARQNLADAYRDSEMRDAEMAQLRQQLAERPKPEVVEREVPPADYDEIKRQVAGTKRESERLNRKYQDVLRENMELQRQLEQANDTLVERGRSSSANRDVEQLINNIYTLLSRHGGKAQAFGDFHLVDSETQSECRKALVALDGFAQNLLVMTEETT